MTSIDRVWIEQRVDLMRDAMRSVVELGFTNATWIALDARADQVTQLTEDEPRVKRAEDEDEDQLAISVGLAPLRDLLEHGIDARRAAQLKAGRFIQRFTVIADSLEASRLTTLTAQLRRAEAWREATRERLNPALIEYLARAHELNVHRARDVASAMLAPSTSRLSALLRVCWSLYLSSSDATRTTLRLEHELKIAQRAAVISLQRRLGERPVFIDVDEQNLESSNHPDELERGLLEALNQARSEPALTLPQLDLKIYGSIHLGASATLTVAYLLSTTHMNTPGLITSLILSLIISPLAVAWFLLWAVKRTHSNPNPTSPHHYRDAQRALKLLEISRDRGGLWDVLRRIEGQEVEGKERRYSEAELAVTLEVMERDVHDYSRRHAHALAQLDEHSS